MQSNQTFDTSAAENNGFDGGVYDTFSPDGDEVFELNSLNNSIQNEVVEVADEDDHDNDFAQELLASLPSSRFRTIRNASAGSVRHRKSVRDFVDNNAFNRNVTDSDDELEIDDVAVRGLTPSNTEELRDMTETLQRKKSVLVRVQEQERRARPITGWKSKKYQMAMSWVRFKHFIKDSFAALDIWRSHMKFIEGLFGTGVLSYFMFLRWLLYINLFICLLTISFLFIPQMIHTQSSKMNNESFTGLELLTGEGWFTHTELYYGQYTNAEINGAYKMKYAYLFVGGGYLLFCVIIIAASMAKSYKENYIDNGEALAPFATKIFCSWDYAISNKESADMSSKNIAQDLVETLGSELDKIDDRSFADKCALTLIRLFTNVMILGLMAGSGFLIFYVSSYAIDGVFENKESNKLKGLLPALTISAMDFIMPSAFVMIASIEKYNSAKTKITITLIRTIILKLASLVVYVVTLHAELTETDKIGSECWETFLGQAFYRLTIVDFIFVLLSIFFGEFLRNIFAKHVRCCHIYRPGFDISKNVLNLIYGQGLCWLGTFYCPLLPVINVVKLVLTFYLKRISVVRNCRPSMRPFKASKMAVLFLALLSLMLILALIVTGYVVIEEDSLKPSTICGPFRGSKTIYAIVWLVIDELPSVFGHIVNVISSVSVIAAVLFLICLLAYYFRMRKQSSEKKIKLLKDQLSLASRDKQFLIQKLRKIVTSSPRSS